MSSDSDNALILHSEMQGVISELDARAREQRSLEADLQAKELELRRAQEEQALLSELSTINLLTLRKTTDEPRHNKMKVADDTLEKIYSLENLVKEANGVTAEMQRQATSLTTQSAQLREENDKKLRAIDHIREVTRFDQAAGTHVRHNDFFHENQLQITELERQQSTYRTETARLTAEIETLTQQVEAGQCLDAEIASAKDLIFAKRNEVNHIEAQKKSIERINTRKLLLQSKPVDDYKIVKQLEGDKRALHTDLLKLIDAKKANEKSILTQDVRMRQIEGRLAAIVNFLRGALVDDESPEHRAGIEEGATGVEIELFEAMQLELSKVRKQISAYDRELEGLDSVVESNEKKSSILQFAIIARTSHASRENRDKERDRTIWNDQIETMQYEFEQEYARLTEENDGIRQRIAAVTSQ